MKVKEYETLRAVEAVCSACTILDMLVLRMIEEEEETDEEDEDGNPAGDVVSKSENREKIKEVLREASRSLKEQTQNIVGPEELERRIRLGTEFDTSHQEDERARRERFVDGVWRGIPFSDRTPLPPDHFAEVLSFTQEDVARFVLESITHSIAIMERGLIMYMSQDVPESEKRLYRLRLGRAMVELGCINSDAFVGFPELLKLEQ